MGTSEEMDVVRAPCCVRFAVVVTFHHATLTTRRLLRLTWAGLAPAGTRQLCLAHRHDTHSPSRAFMRRNRYTVAALVLPSQ
jgi:hypothetical protein